MRRRLGGGVNATIYLVQDADAQSHYQPQSQYIEKVVQAPLNGIDPNRRPHNVKREAELLKQIQHGNVIELLNYTYASQIGHTITLPLFAFTLADLDLHAKPDDDFAPLVKSIAWQCTAGIAHIHTLGIAHRDLNPHNIMFDWNGCIKIIDFGIAWSPACDEKREDGSMVVEVGTGPYRAPELLFGDTSYDPFTIDTWALGTIIAGLLLPQPNAKITIPIKPLANRDPLEDSDEDSNTDSVLSPRSTLFDSAYGDLGLAASIFRILGCPTDDTWPGFAKLPDAGKVQFGVFEMKPLSWILTGRNRFSDPYEQEAILGWIGNLLRLDPAGRMTAEEALDHSWMTEGIIVVPEGYTAKQGDTVHFVTSVQGCSLISILNGELRSAENRLSSFI